MADISNGLRQKYGLPESPSASQVNRWVQETEELIRRGYKNEDAGDEAAKRIFPGYGSRVQKSDADTIAELLETAKRK